MKRIGGFFWKLIVKIAHAILTGLYKIIKKDLTDEAFASWLQFIKFGMVGLMNTLLNYISACWPSVEPKYPRRLRQQMLPEVPP